MNKSFSASLELDRASSDERASKPIPLALPAQARVVLQMLRRLEHGALRVTCPDGSVLYFGSSTTPIALRLNNWKPCIAALRSGDIGFAESYIDGDWQTDDLAGLLQLFIRNRDRLESAIYGNWWGGLLYRLAYERLAGSPDYRHIVQAKLNALGVDPEAGAAPPVGGQSC